MPLVAVVVEVVAQAPVAHMPLVQVQVAMVARAFFGP